MKVLVSFCIIGCNCKYNGGNSLNPRVVDFLSDKEMIAICPEMMGGMSIPRESAEIVEGFITERGGKNVHLEYEKGVELALEKLKDEDVGLAILQSRSPTCGVNQIYDGSFTGKLIKGRGIFAKALIDAGYKVMDSEEI